MFDDFDDFDKPVPVIYPEGFARITRNNVSDIYLIQTFELPGITKVSHAYELDDFDPDRPTCEPFVIDNKCKVEHLGPVLQYFAPKAPLWDCMMQVVHMIPKDYGLLPTIRAIENLKALGHYPSKDEIEFVVKDCRLDYLDRREHLLRVA